VSESLNNGKRPLRTIAWAFVFGFLLFSSFESAHAQPTVSSISHKLMCQCGCSMVLASCNCSLADEMRDVIQQKLDAGQSEAEILAFFVDNYGKEVLSAPTKKGFDLTAWVTPFVAVILAALLLSLALRSWAISGRAEKTLAEATLASEEDKKYLLELEKELKEEEEEE